MNNKGKKDYPSINVKINPKVLERFEKARKELSIYVSRTDLIEKLMDLFAEGKTKVW